MVESPAPPELEKYRKAVILRDGTALLLRPIQPDDEDRILALFYRLSPHTVYLRFHHVMTHMSREEARRLATVDYNDTFALVGTVAGDQGEAIVAIVRYRRLPQQDKAEIAIVVEDAYQGKGIGTHLIEQLAQIAREKGIRFFEGDVLAENHEMVNVLRASGFQLVEEMESGIYRMVLDLQLTPVAEEKSAEREKTATIASLKAFLTPRSVAVIGASQREGSIGNKLFRNILLRGYKGVVYPVNPNVDVVSAVKAYPRILDVPGDVDMAVVIVPALKVQRVVEESGRKGVRGIVVISAGFAESGPEGEERQKKLLETCRLYGMRLVGPNCMGVLNAHPEVSMDATFSSVSPPAGKVAMGTQSGALGLAILEYAKSLNIGLSTFVSIGNRADVSSNDLLEYWGEDPATSVILLYLESFGNPRKFARIARGVGSKKPIIVVKSGRTAAGHRAAASHTGALATAGVVSEALFTQAGIIRVDTLEELFDEANLLVNQPVPPGRRVVILTNGGGPGILTADACAERGLDVSPLSEKTVNSLKAFLRPEASLVNPIDMTAEASAEDYRRALEILAQDERADVVIVIFIPPIVTEPEAVAGAIREVSKEFRRQGKTLVASFMGARGASVELGSKGDECCVPSYAFPEDTAITIAKACDYRDWLKRPAGKVRDFPDIQKEKAIEIVKRAIERNGEQGFWFDPVSVTELLECYGINIAKSRTATTPTEAAGVAEETGFPVAVKLLSDTITHKTEVGGVVLDLRSPTEVEQAFNQIKERLARIGRADEMKGVTVQRMVSEGVEIIVGVTQDPSFGPLLLFGLGGIYTELFKDVAFRIHPLSDVDAREMVRSVKAYTVLAGWRGQPPADIPALEELLLRVSAMVEDLPRIAELDLNPVKALEEGKGYVVVDARIMVR